MTVAVWERIVRHVAIMFVWPQETFRNNNQVEFVSRISIGFFFFSLPFKRPSETNGFFMLFCIIFFSSFLVLFVRLGRERVSSVDYTPFDFKHGYELATEMFLLSFVSDFSFFLCC